MWWLFQFLIYQITSFEYLKSDDQKELTVKGLSQEIFTQDEYHNSGTYIIYEKVTLDYGITTLGDSVFSFSTNLKTIVFPKTLQKIGNNLFYGDSNLEFVYFPEGLRSIPTGTFRDTGIKNLSIPSTVTDIAGGSTFSCSLREIFIPNGNPKYSVSEDGTCLIINGDFLFQVCGGCSSITIPSYIKTLGSSFTCWRGTKSILFEPGSQLKTVQINAFADSQISRIEFPEGLEKIEGPCFANSRMEYVHIPSTLQTVPVNLFDKATKLKTVIVSDECQSVKKDHSGIILNGNQTAVMFIPSTTTAFSIPLTLSSFDPGFMRTNPNFINITVEENHSIYYAEDNLLYKRSGYDLTFIGAAGSEISIQLHENCTSIDEYVFKGTKVQNVSFLGTRIKKIGLSSFREGSSIKEVILANSVTEIYIAAFMLCSLSRITMSPNITTLYESCFYGSKIEKIDLSICQKLTTIQYQCFLGCSELSEIRLPPSLTYIPNSMFSKCTKLDNVSIDTSKVTRIEDKAFFSCNLTNFRFTNISTFSVLKSLGFNCFGGCKFQSIRIPDSVNTIADECFSNCPNLLEITFGEMSQLETLSGRLIAGSNKISKLFLGSKVNKIEENAITESYGLINISISNNNIIFDSYVDNNGLITSNNGETIWAFAGGRTKAYIEAKVKNIKSSAFLNCIKLKAIIFEEKGMLSEIRSSTFFGCSSIERISFPEKLEIIGENSFSGCTNLQLIEFTSNSSLKRIDKFAFSRCSSIKIINIPRRVETISENSFKDCISLKEVCLCIQKNLIGFSEDAFKGCGKLTRVSVSLLFDSNFVLGKPVHKILDRDCYFPTIVFTKKEKEYSFLGIFLEDLLETTICDNK